MTNPLSWKWFTFWGSSERVNSSRTNDDFCYRNGLLFAMKPMPHHAMPCSPQAAMPRYAMPHATPRPRHAMMPRHATPHTARPLVRMDAGMHPHLPNTHTHSRTHARTHASTRMHPHACATKRNSRLKDDLHTDKPLTRQKKPIRATERTSRQKDESDTENRVVQERGGTAN